MSLGDALREMKAGRRDQKQLSEEDSSLSEDLREMKAAERGGHQPERGPTRDER